MLLGINSAVCLIFSCMLDEHLHICLFKTSTVFLDFFYVNQKQFLFISSLKS